MLSPLMHEFVLLSVNAPVCVQGLNDREYGKASVCVQA